jgi:hypothetical protein
MYVRWKKRALKKIKPYDAHPYQLAAYLVESRRIGGRPRQRTIAYLGSIRESNISLPFCLYRRDFWKAADERIAALNLADVDRVLIEDALLHVVPRPTQEDITAGEAEIAAFRNTLRQLAAMRGR